MSIRTLTRTHRRHPAGDPGSGADYSDAAHSPANLLFVANFARDTGYAWATIESVFRAAGRLWIAAGNRADIAYPDHPEVESGTGPEPGCIRLPDGIRAMLGLLRRHRTRILYLTDRPTWSWRYLLYRAAGVRWIIVHDRTSGARRRRGGVLGACKLLLHAIPGLSADRCVAVSNFVGRRLREVNRVPARRVVRIYNGIEVERFATTEPSALRHLLGTTEDQPVVFCSGRAQRYKGIHTLIEAAAILRDRGSVEVAFAYCGDGPCLHEFRELAAARALHNFHFLGKRSDVARLLGGAAVAVVPSVWAEAFGLTVAEAMAAGVPVIGTTAGGIPELIEPGVTGLLATPDDADSLADAIATLLGDPELRSRMGAAGRRVARERFALDRVAREMHDVLFELVHGRAAPGGRSGERSGERGQVQAGR